MYADALIQLKGASKLHHNKAVAACKIYGSHISDLLKQFEEMMKLFAIENELRAIQHREQIPYPTINPLEERIENRKHRDKLMKEVDDKLVLVLRRVETIEGNYQREKEAKQKEQQATLARQPNRPEFNTSIVSTSTPIRNTNTTTCTVTNQQPTEAAVTFNPNHVCHLYPPTNRTSQEGQYKLPANDSIVRRASQTPTNQITTDPTTTAGYNKP